MEKRVIIAVILCVGVLVAWTKLVPQPPAAPPAASAPMQGATGSGPSGSAAAPTTAAVADAVEQCHRQCAPFHDQR